jgi:N6-adenosine-specific RNA methylase IME4
VDPDKRYQVIVTDPPWAYYGARDKWAAAGKFYDCMADDEILRVRYPLEAPGVLLVWTTSSKMKVAIEHIEANGLRYRGVAFVWVKATKDGKPIGAQGVRPSLTKPLTEFVIWGTQKAHGRPLPLSSESIAQTVLAPVGRHSAKPEDVQDRIDAMFPDATKAEFFARRHRHPWDCFGRELENWDATIDP